MGLAWWRGPRAVLLPLYGAAAGAAGAWIFSLPNLPWSATALIIAILWGALAFVPNHRQMGNAAWVILAAAIGVRCLLIRDVQGPNILAIFIAAQTVPRASMIALAWVSRPAGEGIVYEFSSILTTPIALAGMAIGVAAALWCGVRPGAMILVGTYLILRGARWFAYRYASGVNTSVLGVTEILVEFLVLLIFTCTACR